MYFSITLVSLHQAVFFDAEKPFSFHPPFYLSRGSAPFLPEMSALGKYVHQLWAEHFLYTREYVQARVISSPFLDATAKRLFRNQKDLAQVLSLAVQNPSLERTLHAGLKEHIAIAAALVDAAVKGDSQEAKRQRTLWSENGREIAVSLHSGLKSRRSVGFWEEAMEHHLVTTLTEAKALIGGKNGIVQGDHALDHIWAMADAIQDELEKFA